MELFAKTSKVYNKICQDRTFEKHISDIIQDGTQITVCSFDNGVFDEAESVLLIHRIGTLNKSQMMSLKLTFKTGEVVWAHSILFYFTDNDLYVEKAEGYEDTVKGMIRATNDTLDEIMSKALNKMYDEYLLNVAEAQKRQTAAEENFIELIKNFTA